MAREVIIRMTDDFDRSKVADEPVEFEFEGVRYVIDLTAEHADEFRAYMQPYMDHAHEKVKVKRASSIPKIEGETPKDRAKIRKWAKKQGMQVPERGLISREIRAAYAAANGGPVVQGPLTLDGSAEEQPEAKKQHSLTHPPDDRPNMHGITPAMRRWARENGHLGKRGYVSTEARKLYEADQMFNELNQSTTEPALNGSGVHA